MGTPRKKGHGEHKGPPRGEIHTGSPLSQGGVPHSRTKIIKGGISEDGGSTRQKYESNQSPEEDRQINIKKCPQRLEIKRGKRQKGKGVVQNSRHKEPSTRPFRTCALHYLAFSKGKKTHEIGRGGRRQKKVGEKVTGAKFTSEMKVRKIVCQRDDKAEKRGRKGGGTPPASLGGDEAKPGTRHEQRRLKKH